MSKIVVLNQAILSGQTKASGGIDLESNTLVGIQLPSLFTGTTLTFEVATSLSGTYQPMVDGTGVAITKTVAQGKYLQLEPVEFAGVKFLKVVSGSSEGADRVLELVTTEV